MGDKLSIQAQHDLNAAISALERLAKSVGAVSAEEKKNAGAAGAAGKETEKLSESQKKAAGSSDELSKHLGFLKQALVAVGLQQFIKDSTDLFVQQQQAINIIAASTGDIESATEEYERWRKVTETLGIEFNRSSVIYARFLTTAKQAGVPIQNARAAADGLAVAQRAMNLSSYEAELAFRALGQIANKTVVNMEELRQQLGERVAGVMDAVSRKMGITTKELFKLTETGELSAKVFFEKFGPAMAEAFKDQAITNADSLAANLERIGNAGRRIQVEFSSGFADELNRSMKEAGESTKAAEEGFRSLGQGIGVIVGWIGDLLGQFHRIRGFFANVQALLLDVSAGVGDFYASVVEKLRSLFAVMRTAAEGLNLDSMAASFGKVESALDKAASGFRDGARATKELADASRDVARDQAAAQRAIDAARGAASNAKDAINALADGTATTGEGFNKLDPEIAKFIDRISDLGTKTEVAVVALNRLMESGPLSDAQLAAARTEVERLVKAWDFKNIPPELKAVADKLGVATVEAQKHTKATKQMSDAYKELLRDLKAVAKELEDQATEAQKAADENAKRIAELDQLFVNPEDINELFDRRAKQVKLDRDAREAKEALLFAQEDLNAAEAAAAAGSDEFSRGVGNAKNVLDSFLGSVDAGIEKLGVLGGKFQAVGGQAGVGPAGSFGTGVTPTLPGVPARVGTVDVGAALSGARGGVAFPTDGSSIGPVAADPFSLFDQGVGNITRGADLQGNVTSTADILAGQIADQLLAQLGQTSRWEDAVQQEAISKAAQAATQGIVGSGKDGGTKPGALTEITDASGKVTGLTNLSEEGEDLNKILQGGAEAMGETADSAERVKENVEESNSVAGDFADMIDRWVNAGKSAEDVLGHAKDNIEDAADAASALPTGIQEAADALDGASKSGVDLTGAIKRADGAVGDLGFTAAAAEGSIAAAAGAAFEFGESAESGARKAAFGLDTLDRSGENFVGNLTKAEQLLIRITKLMAGGGHTPEGAPL